MVKQYEVTLATLRKAKLYPENTCISDIIKTESIPMAFDCDGKGTCGKCRVKISGVIAPPTAAELRLIDGVALASGVRLACQARLIGPIELSWRDEQGSQNILQDGLLEIEDFNPLWGRIIVPKPEVMSWETLSKELTESFTPEISTLKALANLKKDGQPLYLEYFGKRIIGIGDNIPRVAKLGVAVDIGTTTLAAYLVDLGEGRILKTTSTYNPQAANGADVISRINYAGDTDGLNKLHEMLISAINELIAELTVEPGMTRTDIIQVNLVGNSCMTHFLLGVNPAQLGQIPFEPVFKQMMELIPDQLGIEVNPQAKVFVLPGIGGFIGSDISAGVLACKLSPKRQELFIDIGTNGEVVLSGHGRMIACSTAAGPAFEGAMISCGMLAKPGAITDIKLDEDRVSVTTINNALPGGICGTGLIRAIVELLRQGLICETGRWSDEINHPFFDPEQKRFYLVRGESQPVYLTQQDIRQFQLAKGAIRTGLDLLLKRLAIHPAELEACYLAGAFGTYLHPEDAIFLGLLPDIPLERVRAVGNTAGTGAVLSLLSWTALSDLKKKVATIEHVELAEDPMFTEIFTESMLFENARHEPF